MKILYASSEAAPFAKSGGLADVAGALPKALVRDGIDCRVVMPLYNAERFLRRPVESVLAQSHGELELVVVDDGSTDGGADLVDNYARGDARVRLVRGGRNRGVAAARNHAIELANGRYVTFLDSDRLLQLPARGRGRRRARRGPAAGAGHPPRDAAQQPHRQLHRHLRPHAARRRRPLPPHRP